MENQDNSEKQVPKVEIISKQESFTSLRNLGSVLGLSKQISQNNKGSIESLSSLNQTPKPMESMTHLERERLMDEQHNKQKEEEQRIRLEEQFRKV